MGERARLRVMWLIAGLVLGCTGVGDTYCQSGPKYGTQCYTGPEIEAERRAQGREEPPQERRWWNQPPPSTTKPATLQVSSASPPQPSSSAAPR